MSNYDPQENFDYEKWKRVNDFVNYLSEIHYMNQHKKIVDNMLYDIMIIDEFVAQMDTYPEADYIINKIQRRIDNDKKY